MPVDRPDAQYAPLETSLLEHFVRLVMESHCIPPQQIEDLARALGIRPQDVAPVRAFVPAGSRSLRRREGRRSARRFRFSLLSSQ